MCEERLRQLLADSPTLKIATAGGRVSPWLAAAYFAEDGLYDLRVLIEATGKTLDNISASGKVAVMVEAGNAFGLFAQAEGLAERVPGAEQAFQAALVAKTPPSAPLVRLPNLIPVVIHVQRWLVTDVSAGWLPARELRAPARREPLTA